MRVETSSHSQTSKRSTLSTGDETTSPSLSLKRLLFEPLRNWQDPPEFGVVFGDLYRFVVSSQWFSLWKDHVAFDGFLEMEDGARGQVSSFCSLNSAVFIMPAGFLFFHPTLTPQIPALTPIHATIPPRLPVRSRIVCFSPRKRPL